MTQRRESQFRTWQRIGAYALLLACSAGCGDTGAQGPEGPEGPPGPTGPPGDPGEPGQDAEFDLPGVNLVITALAGGTGPSGRFRVGDRPAVTFTLKTDDGEDLDLAQMSSGSVYVSGPTSNYQRVIASQSDLRARAVDNGNGTWTYTFAVPIPAAYLAPLNDTTAFGPDDGELQGQALLDGTYSVGVQTYKSYTIDGETYRDAGVDVEDFLFGNATVIDKHEIVTNANCNVCHTEVRAHGESRLDVRLCVLCHTTGAEDRNSAGTEGGTPGVSIDFKVMIHKIHNGAHLPSVNGITVDDDGDRVFGTGKPYKVVGFNSSVHNFSDVVFPVFPSLNIPMPKDEGYTGLTSAAKLADDSTRLGIVACAKCHGDPDGAGPAPAPSQGLLHETVPNRQSCGACHDDVDWTKPYKSNGQTMPAHPLNQACNLCHVPFGTDLSVRDAHLHPLLDPARNPGLEFDITSLAEAGAHNGNGKIDPGERIAITFTVADEGGAAIPIANLASMNVVVSGPTSNYNLLLSTSIPKAHPAFSLAPPYTLRLPQTIALEFVGTAGNGAGDSFPTSRSPHLNVTGALTSVFHRTVPGSNVGATTTVDGAVRFQNYLDVASVTNLLRNEYVVVDDGNGAKEFVQIAFVDGTRLWFNTALRNDHGPGAAVQEVGLTARTATTHFTVNAATGVITEAGAGTNLTGDVVVTYTSEFVMPDVYTPPLNDSPDLGEDFGEWTGKEIVPGTYSLDLYGVVTRDFTLYGESNAYRGTSDAGFVDFLVGSATTVEPYDIISEQENCYACHNDLWFHGGGRRGFKTCIVCHASAGGEDRPRYVAGNAPATPRVSISFREMLHKIHMGEHLTNRETYTVVGFGSGAYPDNYTGHGYGEVVFPTIPGGVKQCDKCHGNDAWKEPSDRSHPTEQVAPVRNWGIVCNSCHDSGAATAHIQSQTFNGFESCAVCHSSLRTEDVAKVHKPR